MLKILNSVASYIAKLLQSLMVKEIKKVIFLRYLLTFLISKIFLINSEVNSAYLTILLAF